MRITVLLLTALLIAFAWPANKLSETESRVDRVCYQQTIFKNKVDTGTSATYNIAPQVSLTAQIEGCDSCRAYVQGSIDGTTFYNLTDSLVDDGLYFLSDTVVLPLIRVKVTIRHSTDTVTINLFGRSF